MVSLWLQNVTLFSLLFLLQIEQQGDEYESFSLTWMDQKWYFPIGALGSLKLGTTKLIPMGPHLQQTGKLMLVVPN